MLNLQVKTFLLTIWTFENRCDWCKQWIFVENLVLPFATLCASVAYTLMAMVFYTSGSNNHTAWSSTQVDHLHKWINYLCKLIYYTSESSTQVDKLSMQLNLLHKLSVYTIGSSTQVYLLLKWIFYTSGSSTQVNQLTMQLDLLHKLIFYTSGPSTQVDQLTMQLDLVLMRMSCKKVKK